MLKLPHSHSQFSAHLCIFLTLNLVTLTYCYKSVQQPFKWNYVCVLFLELSNDLQFLKFILGSSCWQLQQVIYIKHVWLIMTLCELLIQLWWVPSGNVIIVEIHHQKQQVAIYKIILQKGQDNANQISQRT